MPKKFALSTDNLTTEQEKAIVKVLGPTRGWWHRLPNFWLIVDNTNTDTVVGLRSLINTAVGTYSRFIIIEVDSGMWAGMLYNNAEINEFDWINKQWN